MVGNDPTKVYHVLPVFYVAACFQIWILAAHIGWPRSVRLRTGYELGSTVTAEATARRLITVLLTSVIVDCAALIV